MKKMLKKYKWGMASILATTALAFVFLVNIVQIQAAEDPDSQESQYMLEAIQSCDKCAQLESSCKTGTGCSLKKGDGEYGVNFTDDVATRTTTITAKKGVFDVYVEGVKQNEQLTNSHSVKISIPNTTDDISISVKLAQADGTCAAGCYVKIWTPLMGIVQKDLDNINYNGVCKDFRENYVPSVGIEEQSKLRELVPYCFSEKVKNNYPESSVNDMITNAKIVAKLNIPSSSGSAADLQPIKPDAIKVSDHKVNLGKLACDAWKEGKNVATYYDVKELTDASNDVCTVTCKEEFTVTYDAPVAVKGGECFTYTVKVESKVNCTTVIKQEKPTMPEVCNPIPYCANGGSYTLHQAGPNDDFDSCVIDCDGGKYSQKCIDKCYKKVYKENKVNELGLNYNTTDTLKLANDIVCPDKTAESILKFKAEHPGGKYVNKNGKVIWEQVANGSPELCTKISGIDSQKPGLYGALYYYQSIDYINRLLTKEQSIGRPATNYTFSPDGIRRRDYGKYQCGDDCKYSTSHCSEESKKYLNASDALKEYNRRLKNYKDKIEQCNDAAKCQTKTSTFHMEVDVSQKGKKTTYKFDANNSPNSDGKTAGVITNPDGIITDYGGPCYGKDSSAYDYMTEINFPGTWMNTKTWEMVYKKNSKYTKIGKDNQFCVPYNVDNTNEKWWVWDVYGKANHGGVRPELSQTAKTNVENSLTQNIRAKIENFGLFGWGVKIECFYAVYNEPAGCNPTCTDTDCITCANPKNTNDETSTNPTNLNIRTVSNSNLFPNSVYDTAKLADENSKYGAKMLSYEDKDKGILKLANTRDVGYNWSAAATNVNNPDYPIVPTALITHIQNLGDNVYSDKYLDYSFSLDSDELRTIKSESTSRNYTEYKGTYENVNGINAYTSDLINKLRESGKGTRNTTIGKNNSIDINYMNDEVYQSLVQAQKALKGGK